VPLEPLSQTTKTVGVRWRRANLDRPAITVEQVEVETLATEWWWPVGPLATRENGGAAWSTPGDLGAVSPGLSMAWEPQAPVTVAASTNPRFLIERLLRAVNVQYAKEERWTR
jgi:hypothetical protein